MKTGLLSLLAGTALMAGVSIAAADEVMILDHSQLDTVSAGALAAVGVASTGANNLGAVACNACGAATAGSGATAVNLSGSGNGAGLATN